MRKTLMLFAMLSLMACARSPSIVTIPPAACSKLTPQNWKQGVEAAPVPKNTDISEWLGKPLTLAIAAAIIAPWAQGYVMQDAQLEKANGRTADSIAITEECERQVNAARPK